MSIQGIQRSLAIRVADYRIDPSSPKISEKEILKVNASHNQPQQNNLPQFVALETRT